MTLATIEINLDEQTAARLARVSPEEWEKLRVLLTVWIREFEPGSLELGELMDTISDNATARGLTPELLESLLSDE